MPARCKRTGEIVAVCALVAGCGSSGSDALTGSGGGTDAGADADGAGGGGAHPAKLSETGLYADTAAGTLAAGVEAYAPRFALWADAASKNRWLSLPAGSQIDASDMDYWRYPVGTRAWKEFSVDGARVETRLLEKTDSSWTMIAYQWRADQSDADAVPEGVLQAAGTTHDIPRPEQCANCHRLPDTLLGVTAIQLDHDGPGLTLSELVQRGQLSVTPSKRFDLPGDAAAQAALGYLHANCGHCHNPQSNVFSFADMSLWLETGALVSVNVTPTYLSTVNRASGSGMFRITPGDPGQSRIVQRMSSTLAGERMPPIASSVVDSVGVATVTAWIGAL